MQDRCKKTQRKHEGKQSTVSQEKSEREYVKHLPSSMVTYKEMQERINARKCLFSNRSASVNKSNSKNEYQNCLPKGFVTYEEMRARSEKKHNTVFPKHQTSHPEERVDIDSIAVTSSPNTSNTTGAGVNTSVIQSRLKKPSSATNIEDFVTSRNDTPLAERESIKVTKPTKMDKQETELSQDHSPARHSVLNQYRFTDKRILKGRDVHLREDNIPSQKHQHFNSKSDCQKRDEIDSQVLGACSSPETSVSVPVLSIIIMNVNGPDDQAGCVPDRRRQVIQSVIRLHLPSIVLFQEFKWKKGISGIEWESCPIPDNYEYSGNEEASILYDSDSVNVTNLSVNLRNILDWLQRSTKNNLRKMFPLDFDPLSRLYAKVVESERDKNMRFLCISWHGPWNRTTYEKRKEYFNYLMEFLRQILLKIKLPILMAGDFNICINDVACFIKPPFYYYKYKTLYRRSEKRLIDFFISTEELAVYDISPLNLQLEAAKSQPNGIFDHDPVKATVMRMKEEE